jgi:hypothetical protein
VAVAVVVAALVSFAWLALVPALDPGRGWDTTIAGAVHDRSSDGLDRFFIVVARVGGGPAWACWSPWRPPSSPGVVGHGRRCSSCSARWSEVLNVTLKATFRRPRPELWESPLPALGWSSRAGTP